MKVAAIKKSKGYKSLHTGIKIGEKFLEIQIRTEEMHNQAEEGSAAHWQYKNLKGNKNKLLTVPYGEDPLFILASFLQSDEGLEVLRILESKLD